MFSRAQYRVRQFLVALRPRVAPADYELVEHLLTPPLRPLFYAMTLRDQQHAIAVCRLLLQAGCRDNDLLAAALLHDIGKGRPRLWQRVVYVLLQATVPGLVEVLAQRALLGFTWLQHFRDHEQRGAALVAAAGGSGTLIRLLGGSPATFSENFRLVLLRSADDAC